MNRNALYAIIGVLVAALVVVGVMYYQDQQTASLEIEFGQDGISVDAN